MKRIAKLLLLAVVVAGAAPAFGEPPATLATWSLANTLTGTTIVPDALVVGDIAAGNGVGSLSLSGKGYSGHGWNSASRNEDAYFEFSVTAITNWSFSPGELSMNFRSTKTGPAKAEVRWSLDGSAWTTAGTMDVPLDGNDRGHPFTVDFTGVTVGSGETFAIRIYAWGASANTGTFRIGNAYAMTLSGSVAAPLDPSAPPRLGTIDDVEVDVGETVSFLVHVEAPETAPVTSLEITAGDPAATLEDGVFSFTPAAAGRYAFTLSAVNANGDATISFNVDASSASDALVVDSTFETGVSGWDVYKESGGKCTLQARDGKLMLAVSSVGTAPYSVQTFYDGVPLYKNGRYRVKYDISCTTDRHVEAMIQQNGGTYQAYTWRELEIKPEPQTVDYEFTMNQDSDRMSKFVFDCGLFEKDSALPEHTIYIDNVSLELLNPEEVVPPVTTYPLWVGGVQVTSANATNILGDGTASFEGTATNGTLYLSNARITEAIAHPNISTAGIYSGAGFDLTISLSGSNRVECAGSASDDYCVWTEANLAITGGGTLIAEIPGGYARGIGTYGNLRIDGATVTASAGNTGLRFSGTLVISNATVTATGTRSYGIYHGGFNGRIDIADSVVTATGGSSGLYILSGNDSSLAVSGASVVTKVTTSDDGRAFYAKALVLRDGLAITEPAGGAFDADEWCVIDPATGGRARRVVIGPPRFAVTVVDGSTTNTTARAGETVTVVANAPEEGKAFVEWSPDDVNDVTFATAAATTTTFAMPARAVTVTAVFKEIQIASIPDQEWTGGPVEPAFESDTVTFVGVDTTLLPGRDYEVSYTNNVDPGTATATVTMAPPRTGHASATFQILPPPEPPAVSNVVARQRWPWNGLVDVDYEVGGDTNLLAGLAAQITFTDSDGRSWVASTFLAGPEPSAEPGPHRATWNAAADAGAGVMASNAIATVSLVRAPEPRWCVIDLSGGSAASSYPVTYVTDVPNVPGGFNADAYKTTNLVLRLVKPSDWADGTFTMGGSCEATLTNAFWIGVFETTQRQWELVAGGRPSYFRRDDGYATRPVEKVSYEMIRGSDAGSMWPDSGDVDEDSFLGKLRARTGLAFDLPTEAQWEFACRATTTTDYNNGSDWTDGTSCTNLDPLGRYWFNGGGGGNGNPDCDTSGGTAAVGSYQPNEWGLYDCHGNVDEWCLDWFGDFAASAVEPVGAPSGEKRVLRGGCWIDNAVNCRSTGRIGLTPDFVGNYYGFRLCLPAVAETAAAAAASAAFRLDTREGPFESDGTETLTYSTLWHPERVASNGTNATVTILQNGDEDEPVASGLLDEGDAVWQVFEDGTYVLTHVTTTNVAVSPVCNEETATFVVRGHPPVEAALRWKYAKNANGWHCAQVALKWHPSFVDEISDMRLLFADRYEGSEPLAVIKTLDEAQTNFFLVSGMIKMAGDDWKYYFLNDENGKVYSERFLESGYREKLDERPTMSDGDEAGSVSGWGSSINSDSYITNGVLNGDGTGASFELTVNGTPTLQLKFASSPHGLGRRTAYLVDPATVVDPLGTTETYRDVEYRVAPVDLSGFAGLADGARAVYGVSDATMASSLDSVPKAERKICLRVVNRDYSTVGRVDNKLAILAWNVGGSPRFLPIAETMSSLQDGDDDPQPAPQPAPRPLSVAEANLSAAFGLAPAAVARGAVTCRVSSMSFGEDGSVEGTFAVAAENAGGVVAESGELAGNVKLTVLGAERLGGAFEPLDPSCGAELLSRTPPYAFRVKAPGKNAFFKVRLEAEDVFE